jgi:H+-transporting ATPase
MASNDARSQAAVSKPGSKPDANEALKSLSMPDLQAKLGSSPDGLTQAEAQKRAQWADGLVGHRENSRLAWG